MSKHFQGWEVGYREGQNVPMSSWGRALGSTQAQGPGWACGDAGSGAQIFMTPAEA